MKPIVDLIKNANKIVLTTHRDCDGDGLGSELALFHALKKLNKDVQIVHVDTLPKRYENFLNKDLFSLFRPSMFETPIDLCLVFDTNDERLIEPLFSEIQNHCKNIIFVDHHPLLKTGPLPTKAFIDTTAASTGEITYNIIKHLDIPIDTTIAESLYLSIAFDTQLFRYVRRSIISHQIAIEILPLIPSPEAIHRNLFGGQTPEKISFISKALSKIMYFLDNKIAIVLIHSKEISDFGLTAEDTRDVVDKILDIDCVQVAVLFREDSKNRYKISFRSKSFLDVLEISELFGGGGHHHASGAMIEGEFLKIRDQIIDYFKKKIE
ncbi:MAG: DHH family phosphoesterase [Bdellovibrionaceae bacterium]|nr:DHH family phosphoesterase [Pseudobdellovibrionaceae bacterium]